MEVFSWGEVLKGVAGGGGCWRRLEGKKGMQERAKNSYFERDITHLHTIICIREGKKFSCAIFVCYECPFFFYLFSFFL